MRQCSLAVTAMRWVTGPARTAHDRADPPVSRCCIRAGAVRSVSAGGRSSSGPSRAAGPWRWRRGRPGDGR